MEVTDIVESPEYEAFRLLIYGRMDHRKLNNTIWRDIRTLEIGTKSMSEQGENISRKLKDKVKNNPSYRRRLQRIISDATQKRIQLYENCPSLQKIDYEKSRRARKKKFDEDPEFRKMTLRNLSKGTESLWTRVRDDPEYGAKILRTMRKGIAKANNVRIRRARKRRTALYKQVISREFDSLDERIGQKYVAELLNTKYKRVRDKYYSDVINLESKVKKDLAALREEMSEAA